MFIILLIIFKAIPKVKICVGSFDDNSIFTEKNIPKYGIDINTLIFVLQVIKGIC